MNEWASKWLVGVYGMLIDCHKHIHTHTHTRTHSHTTHTVLNFLGERVVLKGWERYKGGLDNVNDGSGECVYVMCSCFMYIHTHVQSRMCF